MQWENTLADLNMKIWLQYFCMIIPYVAFNYLRVPLFLSCDCNWTSAHWGFSLGKVFINKTGFLIQCNIALVAGFVTVRAALILMFLIVSCFTECADGSLMFNFGSAEQVQSSKEVANGTTIDEVKNSDSGDVRAVVNGSHSDTAAEEFVARPEVSSDFDDVPDAETLSDLARGAEALAQELNVKEDEQRGEEARREEAQPQSEPSDQVLLSPSLKVCMACWGIPTGR